MGSDWGLGLKAGLALQLLMGVALLLEKWSPLPPTPNVPNFPPVVAVLCCQLDSIWNELKPKWPSTPERRVFVFVFLN